MTRLYDRNHQIFSLRTALLTILAILAAGCNSGRDQPDQAAEAIHPANSIPSATAPEGDATITSQSLDTLYSDGPKCNALVKRIAEEMLPCLQRIKPEMAGHLQVSIERFRNGPRLRLDQAERDAVLKKVDEDCEDYWRQIQHQLDSKAPEGQCLLDAVN